MTRMLRIFRRYQKKHVDNPGTHPFYQEWGQHDQVFYAATRQFSTAALPSLTSIRYVIQGGYTHHSGNVPFRLRAGDCLISRPGSPYAVEIDSLVPVMTLEVHYSHSTARELSLDANNNSVEEILDPGDKPLPEIIDRIEQPDADFLNRIRQLMASTIDSGSTSTLAARTNADGLLLDVLRRQSGNEKEWQRLSAARASTRKELYRRLVRARDYLLCHFDKKINIEEVSQVACLSRFHFQRLFREAFGISVYQMMMTRRLQWAQSQLRTGESVTAVSRQSGFAHESSFSRAYKRQYGYSPRHTVAHRK